MTGLFLLLMIGLEFKHFIADYVLQPAWILVGKGDWRLPGGYAHAGLHAVLSGVVLLIAGVPFGPLLGLVVAEFVLHYVLDYAKIQYSKGVHVDAQPSMFWRLHGIDQLAHQITYAAMIWIAVAAKGLG